MDKTEIKKIVGEKIRTKRTYLKLSQFVLGEKAGINQRQVAQIECGKSMPSLNTLIKFSEIFKCEIAYFFENNEFKSAKELKQEIINQIEYYDYTQLEMLHTFFRNFTMINTPKFKI